MSHIEKQIVALDTEIDPGTAMLHEVADYLANLNLDSQIGGVMDTLEFLRDIEFKDASDLEKIKECERILEVVQSKDYFNEVRNTFAEHYSKLDARSLERYLNDLKYEAAIAEVGVTLVPALQQLQDKFSRGVFKKREIH